MKKELNTIEITMAWISWVAMAIFIYYILDGYFLG